MKGFSLRFRIESKLFNGYVMQPIPIVILWSIVGIAILALAISCSLEPLLEPSTPECSITKCEFISYSGDGPTFVIMSNEDQVYNLPADAIEDEHILESIIENKTTVKVSYKLPSAKKSNACDIVEITNVDGSVIVSQEAISAANAKNYRNSLITMWSMCLVYWGLGIGGYCMVSERQRQYKSTHARCNMVGTMLCILSPVPIFIGMAEGSDLAMILAVCGMLFLAGGGAAVFVVTGVRWASMQKILQSGDYAPAEKKRSQKEKALSAAYWTLAVAVYLGWNFTTEDWKNTWIVWPVAGVLYAAVLHLYRLFTKSRED